MTATLLSSLADGDPSPAPKLVAVIDATPQRLRRLAGVLSQSGRMTVAAACDSVEALAATGHTELDAIVLSFGDGPVEDSARVLREASARFAPARVVAMASGSDRAVRRLVRAGAAAFVRESDGPDVLVVAIEAACLGQTSVPLDLSYHVGETALSVREKQVLALVVLGQSNGEIARQLFLADSTVKSHLGSAYRKLGVRSRKEAVALVLDPDGGVGMGVLSITRPTTRAEMQS